MNYQCANLLNLIHMDDVYRSSAALVSRTIGQNTSGRNTWAAA